MKFAVLTKPYQFEIKDYPYPELNEQEVLIAVKKVGICGSEITAYRGIHQYRIPPVILGHEMVGAVSAIGKTGKRLKVGDRVVVKPHTFCGLCPDCLDGNQNFCKEKKVLGSREWPGAFGEFIVAPEHLVHPLPSHITDEQAALLDPLCVGLHAVRKAGVQAGDRIVILGAGSIGLSSLLAALASGAEVYVTDIKDKNLEIARALGATGTFNVSRAEESSRLEDLSASLRMDTVMVTAGTEGTVSQAIKMIRRGGQVIILAHFHNPMVPVDMFTLLTQEKNLHGSITYTSLDLERGIQLLSQKKLNVLPLISEHRSLEEIQRCFERLAAGEEGLIKVLITL